MQDELVRSKFLIGFFVVVTVVADGEPGEFSGHVTFQRVSKFHYRDQTVIKTDESLEMYVVP